MGSQLYFPKYIVFLSLEIDFELANCADPEEIAQYAAFHLGLHCLKKYLFWWFLVFKWLFLCVLGTLSCFCCPLLSSFKIKLSNKFFQEQMVWIQIRIHILLLLIWVQTVCKGYQQMTKVAASKERVKKKFYKGQ